MNKEFNGNLRGSIDLLENTKENLAQLWESGEVRLTMGEITGITDALTQIDEKMVEIKASLELFDKIALKK